MPSVFTCSSNLERFQKLDNDGNLIWSRQLFTSNDEIKVPRIAADDDENVYIGVEDGGLFSGYTTYIEKRGPSGTGPLWQYSPATFTRNIFAGPDNHLYFTDGAAGSSKVVKLTLGGSHVWTISHSDDDFRDVSSVANGDAFFGRNSILYKVNSSGGTVWTYTMGGTVRGAIEAGDGSIYAVAANDGLVKLTSAGAYVWDFTDMSHDPFSVAMAPDGSVIIQSISQIKKVDSSGGEVWFWDRPSGSPNVTSLRVDPFGFIYVAHGGDGTRKIDSDGSQILWTHPGHVTSLDIGPTPLMPENLTVVQSNEDLLAEWESGAGEFVVERERWLAGGTPG